MKKHCQGTEPEEVHFLIDTCSIQQVINISQEYVDNSKY